MSKYAVTCVTWGNLASTGESIGPPVEPPNRSYTWRLVSTNVTPIPGHNNCFLFTYTWER